MRKVIHIEGMHCGHCAGLVNIQLYGLKEVMDVKTDIGNKTSIVTLSRDVENDMLVDAVEKAGYRVTSIA